MATLFDPGIFSIVGISGEILVGAKLHWYATGTTTPATTYSDEGLTTPNANPIVADAGGRFGPAWLDPGDYKFVLTTSAGVVIVTRDPWVVSAPPPSVDADLEDFLAGTAALPIANGGTGQTSAANAIAALGGLPLTGGAVTGAITRSTKGAHIYFETAAMANGGFFLTAAADPDPTSLAGQIWAKY